MKSALLLGCIADDFTGATDLANTLVRGGMRTVQLLGVPDQGLAIPDADAIVVALKSRTIAAPDAVGQSLDALRWLQGGEPRQTYFKYCSTFDSTDRGNIGPVADALLAALGAPFSVACPAFPENGRTIYQGHLFVGAQLLSESSMRNHPLTPMTDANLVRVLSRQTSGRVGVIDYAIVRQGVASIRAAIARLTREGFRYAILDAIENQHLFDLGAACADLALVTGGSGMALGLPDNFRRPGLLGSGAQADVLPRVGGYAAVIAGSCSVATLAQIAYMKRTHPAYAIDPLALARGEDQAAEAARWAKSRLLQGPVLVYSSAPPEEVARVQTELGRDAAGGLIEQALASVAKVLVGAGVRKLVVAGGETAGAVVGSLGVRALRIGPQIDPGVPWTVAMDDPPIALALKSGNFGAEDFFLKALDRVQ
jgi:uncharacterized protein YgbK (DUF1537 family)